MKILYMISIFWFLLIIGGCNKENNTGILELNLDVKPEEKGYSYSDFFDKISCYKIPIEEIRLGDMIKKIVTSENLIFILDHRMAKAVVCLNKDGSLRYVLNNKGKGPGEYIQIWNISVCNEVLYVYDVTQKKIIQYNSVNGEFIREDKVSFKFRDFLVTEQYSYYLTLGEKKESHWLYIVNNKTFQIKKELPIKEFPNLNIPERANVFFKSNDQVILCHSYFETIFKIMNDEVMPYIVLNAGSKSLFNYIDKLDKSNKGERMEIQKKCISSFGDYYENEDFIWFTFRKPNTIATLQHVVFNKETGDAKIMNKFKNDITFKYSQLFKGNGNDAISILDIGTLIRIKEMEKDEFRFINDNKEILEKLDFNDNPLIIKYHAKE